MVAKPVETFSVGAVLGWGVIVAAVASGCVLGERAKGRSFGARGQRQRRILAGLLPLALCAAAGQQSLGFVIFAVACSLPLLALASTRQFRPMAYIAATLTGLVGLASVLPFILLGGPLLILSACIASAARVSTESAAGQPLGQRRLRSWCSPVLLLGTANCLVLMASTALVLGARPG